MTGNSQTYTQARNVFTTLLITLWMSNPGLADDRIWTNTTDGIFHDPANWLNDEVPGPGDTATFNLAGQSPVISFDNDAPDQAGLVVRNGMFSFSIGDHEYSTGPILVGRSAGEDATLAVVSGQLTGLPISTTGLTPLGEISILGESVGSTGTAIVRGSTAVWTEHNQLIVGFDGTGSLTVDEEGTLVVNESMSIGNFTGTGTATVRGAGSALVVNEFFGIGASFGGASGELIVEQGAQVTTNGTNIGSDGGTATAAITDPGSVWTDNWPVFNVASETGGDGALSINNGGHLNTTGIGNLGFIAGTTGTVTITGTDSLWQHSGGIDIGAFGHGVLALGNGGRLASGANTLAVFAGSSGEATIADTGTLWQMTGKLEVGLSGDGSVMIENGAGVESATGLIGVNAGASGSVTLTDAGSIWTIDQALYAGGDINAAGGDGLLVINNGGLVRIAEGAGPFTIWTTGTLAGDDGTVQGQVTSYGTLAPGNSIGVISIEGSLTLTECARLEYDLVDSENSDRINITGDLTLDGILKLSTPATYTAGTYTLMTYSGTLTDQGLSIANPPAGFDAVIDTANAGEVRLQLTSNPAQDVLYHDRFECDAAL